jgi:hypothetical protein
VKCERDEEPRVIQSINTNEDTGKSISAFSHSMIVTGLCDLKLANFAALTVSIDTESGAVFCWGPAGTHLGQVPRGHTCTSYASPLLVSPLSSRSINVVACGAEHTLVVDRTSDCCCLFCFTAISV